MKNPSNDHIEVNLNVCCHYHHGIANSYNTKHVMNTGRETMPFNLIQATFEDRTYFPGCDWSKTGKLAKTHFQEENWETNKSQHDDIRNEKGSWENQSIRAKLILLLMAELT